MNAITAINAYKKVGIESSVIGADPHQLISMLFQGALLAIANAKNEMLRKEICCQGQVHFQSHCHHWRRAACQPG